MRLVCIAALLSFALRAQPVAVAGPFEFHSNFWLNLHHFLYQQALQSEHPSSDLTWDKAVASYRQNFISHDLLNDAHLRSIEVQLSADETLAALPADGPDAPLWNTLNSVAQSYRVHWWPAHDQANRAFISAAVPLVQQYGRLLIKQLTAAYETPWPTKSIYVDISEYANWAGAYTFIERDGRAHEIVSSSDAANQGNAALEILFHEASHALAGFHSGRLADQIAAASKASSVKTPRDLVHIFIFYTAGELTRRDLAGAGIANYVPYADLKHLYDKETWGPWHSRIDLYWKQHLDGKLSLDEAVNKIVAHSENVHAQN